MAAAPRETPACSEPTRHVPACVVVGDADPATRIRGRIASATGGVLPGARAVLDLGVTRVSAGLDAGGAFDVAVPASTPVVRVLAVAPLCVPAAGTWSAVAPGRGADVGTLGLEPCAALRGRVLDESDAPVAAALVEFGPADRDPTWDLAMRTFGVGAADGNERGEFSIDVRPAGALTLRARSATHEFESVDLPGDAAHVVLRGSPHADGPRIDLDLRFTPPDVRWPEDRVVAESAGSGVVEGETSALNGMTRFRVALPTTLRLVGSPEHEPFALRVDRLPRGKVTIPLRPRRNTALGGDVVLRGVATVGGAPATWSDGADGRPPHGHRLRVLARRRPDRRERDDAPSLAADTTTREDGTFELRSLVRGRYTVRVDGVDASYGDPAAAPLPGRPSGPEPDGTFRPEAVLRQDRVVVLDLAPRFRAAGDLFLECAAATSSERLACEVTTESANPIVRVRGVPPAESIDLSVRVRAEGRWTRRTVERIAPDRLASVAVPDGERIRCRVLARPGGPPAPGVEVTVRRYRREPGDVVATDAEGRIDLDGFEPGSEWNVYVLTEDARGAVEARAGGEEVTIAPQGTGETTKPAR